MRPPLAKTTALRAYRNAALYRPLARTLRVYTGRVVAEVRARGFADFSPAFPPLLSNLDVQGTQIGVLARRAGVTRQAAGQLVREIERCGYVSRHASPTDARATVVRYTPKGRRLIAAILDVADATEREFATHLAPGDFDKLRDILLRLANTVDPIGAFGVADEKHVRPRKATRHA